MAGTAVEAAECFLIRERLEVGVLQVAWSWTVQESPGENAGRADWGTGDVFRGKKSLFAGNLCSDICQPKLTRNSLKAGRGFSTFYRKN